MASFPEGITRPIQYGQSVKSHAVYLSQFQLIPYERVADYFINESNIPHRQIIRDEIIEMPPPLEKAMSVDGKKKRGRDKKTKELNLLERLRDFENDVLRFMEVDYVPFTNNRGENDIRMTTVQQKISGCFKSMDGAKIFCRVRSYLLTAQKHGVTPTDALKSLFNGELPAVLLAD